MDELILDLLKKKRQGLSFHQMARDMGISAKEKKNLKKNLKKLEGRGIIQRRKEAYFVPAKSGLVRGEFLGTMRGFGFVRPEGGGADIFIPSRHTGGALGGDAVEILFLTKGKKGKPEGRVLRILKKGRRSLLGVYSERFGQAFFLPLDSPLSDEIPLSSKGSHSPRPGMIVEIERDTRRITGLLGMPDDPGVDTRVVIRRHELEEVFSGEALEEARSLPARIPAAARKGRQDYRRWPAVTIDGEKAQDFDDAVSIKRLPSGNFLLGVHIADVSHYVRPGSAMDRDALVRGTSVYLPDLTLPMLPEKLSNDLCSLRPRRTRLAFSVIMEIDRTGGLVGSEFHPSVIRTVERMTYTSVFKIFQGDAAEMEKYPALLGDFLALRELAALMRKRREEAGSLNFDLVEPELVYQEGKLTGIQAFEQNEAHHLIEEFMVAANEAVASHLNRLGIPSIYRVHPAPSVLDLEDLCQRLLAFGILLPKADRVGSRDLQRALKAAEGRPEEKYIHYQVLRALRLAVYSSDNTGHFGLAKDEYTHFTSPIRRYPDLVVHRILKAALAGERSKTGPLEPLAVHVSRRERLADEAERDLVMWRIFRFLKARLGDELPGIIVDINRAGLVVELEDYFVEGLMAFHDLDGDYYYLKSGQRASGKRTGRKFSIGDRIRVGLAAVDPILRRISLVLAGDGRDAAR